MMCLGAVIVYALGTLTMTWAPVVCGSNHRQPILQFQPYWIGSAAAFVASGAIIYQIGLVGFPIVSIAGAIIAFLASMTLPRQAIAASSALSVAGALALFISIAA
jgi:hypothetical protein